MRTLRGLRRPLSCRARRASCPERDGPEAPAGIADNHQAHKPGNAGHRAIGEYRLCAPGNVALLDCTVAAGEARESEHALDLGLILQFGGAVDRIADDGV